MTKSVYTTEAFCYASLTYPVSKHRVAFVNTSLSYPNASHEDSGQTAYALVRGISIADQGIFWEVRRSSCGGQDYPSRGSMVELVTGPCLLQATVTLFRVECGYESS